jgi:hypothetical protein
VLKYEASGGHELHGRTDDDAPIAINGNTGGTSELPCAAALAVDGAHVSPVPIPQHLHAMIEAISYNKVTRVIKGNAPGIRELTCTRTSAADGAHMQPVPVPQHLDAMIVTNCG